jgi:hypothetical protein
MPASLSLCRKRRSSPSLLTGNRRLGLLTRLIFFLFLFVSPASAAPTCQDLQGETVRCGTDGAMPVGWKLPSIQHEDMPPGESLLRIVQAVCVLGVFFCLLALMPDFDGSRPGDWDAEEDERNLRR